MRSRVLGIGLVLTASATGACKPAPEGSSPPSDAPRAETPAVAPATARELPEFCAGTWDEAPVPATSRATLVGDGFVFVEGPAWAEPLGAFLFSEMDFGAPDDEGPPAKVHKLVLPDRFEVFLPASGSNGLAVDDDGGLLACTHDTQTVSRFDLTTRERATIVPDYGGKHFNSPNDIAVHSAGHLYFTDPDWQLGKRTNETGMTGAYWVTPGGEVTAFDRTLDKPNGITLSPDETHLYVGAVDGVIRRYPLGADGSVGAAETFARVDQPDGMAVDCAGNLYVTSHGPGKVHVLSPDGTEIATIDVAPRTTNVAFGGPDRKTLLVTAGTGIYMVQSATPGFPY